VKEEGDPAVYFFVNGRKWPILLERYFFRFAAGQECADTGTWPPIPEYPAGTLNAYPDGPGIFEQFICVRGTTQGVGGYAASTVFELGEHDDVADPARWQWHPFESWDVFLQHRGEYHDETPEEAAANTLMIDDEKLYCVFYSTFNNVGASYMSNSDDDNDGLSDFDEINLYGTDPLDADTDNDGYADGTEIARGVDAKDRFSVPVVQGGEGNLVWIKRATGTSIHSSDGNIAALPNGGSIVTGHFGASITFAQGETNETTLTGSGDFVAKYDQDGTLDWAKEAAGSVSDIAIPPNGSILATGTSIVAKYGPDGILLWAKSADTGGRAIATLSDGSALVTGEFSGTALFGPDEPHETELTSAGGRDIFVAKLNPDGELLWVKRAGGADDGYSGDVGYDIAALADGTAFVTGTFLRSATFGLHEDNETTLMSDGASLFLAKYRPNGTLEWVKCVGTYSYFPGRLPAIDAGATGGVFLTGTFEGIWTFGPGEPTDTTLAAGYGDIFVAKYNQDGSLAWAKCSRSAPRTGSGDESVSKVNGLSALPDGGVLVTGEFCWLANENLSSGTIYTVTFGQNEANETTLACTHGPGFFLAKFSADGTLAWAKPAVATEEGWGHVYDCRACSFSDHSAIVTGRFQGPVTFGSGEPNETTLTDHGMFMARFAGLTDADDDGLPDYVETNTGIYVDETNTGTDPDNSDTDNDGLTDGGEHHIYGTSPINTDTDGDGLSDGDEVNYDGDPGYNPYDPIDNPQGTDLDPTEADTDGDGASDGREVSSGTDPLDETDAPACPFGDVDCSGQCDAVDVQLVINDALGLAAGYDCDLNVDSSVDAADVQLVINTALGIDVTAPSADFSLSVASGEPPLSVTFTDRSRSGLFATIASWLWDFGDGTTSIEQNPAHEFTEPGLYTVALTVTTDMGEAIVTRADLIAVGTMPIADFSCSPSSGPSPLSVSFTDASLSGTFSIVSWEWDFGDGATSGEQEPIHEYSEPGQYDV